MSDLQMLTGGGGLLLRRRMMMQSRKRGHDLPAGYREVEYLRSTGSEYVLVDLPLGYPSEALMQDTEVTIIARCYTQEQVHLMGQRSDFKSQSYTITLQTSGSTYQAGSIYFNYGTQYRATQTDFDLQQFHKYKLSKGNLYVDGILIASIPYTTFIIKHTLTLFGIREGPGQARVYLGASDIAYFKLDNDTANAHCELIPCYRESDGRKGFIDLLDQNYPSRSGQLLWDNLGPGDFIAGPDV